MDSKHNTERFGESVPRISDDLELEHDCYYSILIDDFFTVGQACSRDLKKEIVLVQMPGKNPFFRCPMEQESNLGLGSITPVGYPLGGGPYCFKVTVHLLQWVM